MKDWVEAVILATFFFIGGCTFGARTCMYRAVQHGGAKYNSQSGNFEWVDHTHGNTGVLEEPTDQ